MQIIAIWLARYHSRMNSRLPRDATLRFMSPKINLDLPQGLLSEIDHLRSMVIMNITIY